MSGPDNQLFRRILIALAAGVAVGLLLGDSVQPLELVSNAFIRLLQVNVLPYLLGSLIASLGSRGTTELRLIARYGIGLLLSIWALALLIVVFCPLAFPVFGGTPFIGLPEEVPPVDWLDLYIPSNLFRALANNLIPAVVLFGILAGLALGQMSSDRRDILLRTLDSANEALTRISRLIMRLTPIGLFAIAAVTAGELHVEDVLRLQVWILFYTGICLIFTFWVLPALVSQLTPVPFGRFLRATRSAVVTAAAAGDSLVVLPLIAEAGKELLAERGAPADEAEQAMGVAVPLLYNFPHAAKVISLGFLPFAAWYSGSTLDLSQLGVLASAGLMSLFGSLTAAVPFLLDLLHLPADLFELFTMSGVVNGRVGSMTAAMHYAALSLLIAAAMLGRVRLSLRPLLRFSIITASIVALFIAGTRATFTWVLPPEVSGLATLSSFELRPPLVSARLVEDAATTTAAPKAGERLPEIRARGLLRVGFFPDAMPWAFVNARGDLVGYDVESAHRLARQLGVGLEFVRLTRSAAGADLTAGRADLVMSGYVASVGRAQEMELSEPYSSEHVGFLVRDHLRNRFATVNALGLGDGLTIGYPAVPDARDLVTTLMPRATLREFQNPDSAIDDPAFDGLLMTLERASYWSRVHAEYTAVRPAELNVATLTVYGIPRGEFELRNLVDLWIETRRASGELDEAYQYWVRGRALDSRRERPGLLRRLVGSR